MSKSVFAIVVLLFSAGAVWGGSFPQMDIYEAINKAGYQRMLTQRIAKSYLAVVSDIEAQTYKEHLHGSAKMFENNLKELKEYAPTDEVKNQFRYVEILWRNYKFIYSDEYTIENAQVIMQFNDKILKACDDAVKILENYAQTITKERDEEMTEGNDPLSRIINESGRQRMLTQRLLLLSLAKIQRVGSLTDTRQKFNQALSTFRNAFKDLMSYKDNTEAIDRQIFTVTGLWDEIETAMLDVMNAEEPTLQQKEALIKALKKSDQVLFYLDEIVFLYERLAD